MSAPKTAACFSAATKIFLPAQISARAFPSACLCFSARSRRIASRSFFRAHAALPWEQWIGADDAFPVKGYSIDSDLFSVRDCQAIIKKAVVERLKQKYSIEWFEESGPVYQIQFSIMKNKVSLMLDTSGAGLHKRGYRQNANDAPIKETLAASLCWFSRLRPYHSLYTPCADRVRYLSRRNDGAAISPPESTATLPPSVGAISRAMCGIPSASVRATLSARLMTSLLTVPISAVKLRLLPPQTPKLRR